MQQNDTNKHIMTTFMPKFGKKAQNTSKRPAPLAPKPSQELIINVKPDVHHDSHHISLFSSSSSSASSHSAEKSFSLVRLRRQALN